MTSPLDLDYAALRAQPPAKWRAWLESHAQTTTPFHWWLAMAERSEADLLRALRIGSAEAEEKMAFAVAVLDESVARGDWRPPYAAGMRCRYASEIADRRIEHLAVPDKLTPDGAARNALESFPLTPEQVGSISIDLVDSSDPKSSEQWQDWQDISWALYFVKKLVNLISDADLADQVSTWITTEAAIV